MKSLLMITGASKGIGQAIASEFVQSYLTNKGKTSPKSLVCILLARSEEGLSKTSQNLHKLIQNQHQDDDKIDFKLITRAVDLATLSTLEETMSNVLNEVLHSSNESFDETVFVNNAGSLGHLGPLESLTSLFDLQQNINLNITSSLWLSSWFVRTLSSVTTKKCLVVNVSSLCALKPFNTMGVYCSTKAAREMFHTVFANELIIRNQEIFPVVKLLNYAPGPCATDMTTELSVCRSLDPSLSQYFGTAVKEQTLIDPFHSAARLVNLINRNEFNSGSHIDYNDIRDDGSVLSSVR